jgi:hypothetical protein
MPEYKYVDRQGLRAIQVSGPAEDSAGRAAGADQRIWYPSVRPWPKTKTAEPAGIPESIARLPDELSAFSAKQWWPEEEPQHAVPAQSHVRAPDEQATTAVRLFWPRNDYEWFLFVTVVHAFTVVPLVWILGVKFFF